MLGKHHVLVNEVCVGTCLVIDKKYVAGQLLCTHLYPEVMMTKMVPRSFAYLVATIVWLIGVWLGSLLPDIDSKSSYLGRYVHLPLKHRTWTHTIWAVLLLFFLCLTGSFGCSIWLGYTLHVVVDSFSVCGVCWTYPLKKYRYFSNGAMVKPHHRLKLYHAGKNSETVCFWIVIAICIIVLLLCL